MSLPHILPRSGTSGLQTQIPRRQVPAQLAAVSQTHASAGALRRLTCTALCAPPWPALPRRLSFSLHVHLAACSLRCLFISTRCVPLGPAFLALPLPSPHPFCLFRLSLSQNAIHTPTRSFKAGVKGKKKEDDSFQGFLKRIHTTSTEKKEKREKKN